MCGRRKRLMVAVKGVESGWSEWGSWSDCSRLCDGGVSVRLRQCLSSSGCQGSNADYAICNMQACESPVDFRAVQCSAFNNVPYRGNYYEWIPIDDPTDPCSLTCQSKTFQFMAKLANRVKDGTRCKPGTLNMCVAGKCMPVGCDLVLGSTAVVDDCGVCGGNGTSCANTPTFYWEMGSYQDCPVECGGGLQHAVPQCRNKDQIVDDRLCDSKFKPEPITQECATNPCPPSWSVSEWGECDASCGGGEQRRKVHCVRRQLWNESHQVTDDHYCPGDKPDQVRNCNTHDCPLWTEGQWSQCSVSCGIGYQSRVVECRDSKGHLSTKCNMDTKPSMQQQCFAGQCGYSKAKTSANKQNLPQDSPREPNLFKMVNKEDFQEPTFATGDWGPCSVQCGEGYQKRSVQCKIFLEFSKLLARLPDSECSGPRPADFRRCIMKPCSQSQLNNETDENSNTMPYKITYSWRMAGFTPCSASCLGGVRESLVKCVRDYDEETVSYYLCDIRRKPETYTETCNDRPCPPQWNVSVWSECSRECGGGWQRRGVSCVQEVTRGSGNTLTLPNSLCISAHQPQPVEQQLCNTHECQPRWIVEKWSKCSRLCGGGTRSRKVRCEKSTASGALQVPSSMCDQQRKPRALRPCNHQPCIENESTYIQPIDQRKVSLTATGRVIAYKGSTLKIRCPGVGQRSHKVKWFHNGKIISTPKRRINRRSTHISKGGLLVLRKLGMADGGVYTCRSGRISSDINLLVRPLYHNITTPQPSIDVASSFATESNLLSTKDADELNELDKLKNEAGVIEPDKIVNSVSSSATSLSGSPMKTLMGQMLGFKSSLANNDDVSRLMKASNLVVLGRGPPENVQFEWRLEPWTPCTLPCGGQGFQIRQARCVVRVINVTKDVDSVFCTDAGTKTPELVRRCGMDECPRWTATSWSQCETSECHAPNVAVQRRDLQCRFSNGTVVEQTICEERTKPVDRKECYNPRCKPQWIATEWSECPVRCGESGVQTRYVQCVWANTTRAAGNICDIQLRPDALQVCQTKPCPPSLKNDESACDDQSQHCAIIVRFQMCDLHNYHQICCSSCQQQDADKS